MSKTKEMIPLSQALQTVKDAVGSSRLDTERIPVRQGLGRILAEDQRAKLDLPPFDKSAMDGYAIMADDNRPQYRLLETVPAGAAPTKALAPGTAIKVMTGSPVPQGTGRVIMLEHTCEADGTVHLLSEQKDANICRKGEDVRAGDLIAPASSLLGPLEIANLISAGISEVQVSRQACLAIVATGDEIVESTAQLTPGKIMNSNSPMLAALCRQHQLEVVLDCVVPDKLDPTVSTLGDALKQADIVVLSGGVSVGEFDFATAAMTELGLTVHFDCVAVKPGKPVTFATGEEGIVFGLPGNPVSAYLMFNLFVWPSARLMMGGRFESPKVSLALARDFSRRKTQRVQFVPCRLRPDGTLEAVEFHGSAHLQGLAESDGFFIVPQGVGKIESGQKADFISFKGSAI